MNAGGVYSNRKGVYSLRIRGNYLSEIVKILALRLLAADDGDDEEDEEDEDEERRHDDEKEEDEEEEETVWTIPQGLMPVNGMNCGGVRSSHDSLRLVWPG